MPLLSSCSSLASSTHLHLWPNEAIKMKRHQLGHFHYHRGRKKEKRVVLMEQCQGRSRQTGGKYIYTDIALMSLQHGDLRLNFKKAKSEQYPFQLQGGLLSSAIQAKCYIKGTITCSMSAWGEWTKMEALSLGEDSRQSWASVARGL